jgi:hypothetical protein
LLKLVLSLAGVIMLLSFPSRSAHDFHQHFRTARIRRSVVSHTFAETAPEAPAKTACQAPIRPTGFLPVDLALASEAPAKSELPTPVSPSSILRLFPSRLARASGDDPLI